MCSAVLLSNVVIQAHKNQIFRDSKLRRQSETEVIAAETVELLTLGDV